VIKKSVDSQLRHGKLNGFIWWRVVKRDKESGAVWPGLSVLLMHILLQITTHVSHAGRAAYVCSVNKLCTWLRSALCSIAIESFGVYFDFCELCECLNVKIKAYVSGLPELVLCEPEVQLVRRRRYSWFSSTWLLLKMG